MEFKKIMPLTLNFPEQLPVSARRGDIAQALRAHPVIIVCGETGSGKTTQLPKICLAEGRGWASGGKGLIGHTQPRRLAATSVAKRIASELNSPLGEHVGYKIRFHDKLSRGASVKLMTDGILLAETQSDPLLRAYDTLIIDEAHERSLNIDFLLGYLKQLLPRRPDLKVIVTSATIDAQRFSEHFFGAPVIEVSGRTYPVEVRWRPLEESGNKPGSEKVDMNDALLAAVDELAALGPGDVLVFLPSEREIREAAEALRKHHPAHTEILPLFSRLSAEEQDRIFKPSNARRIVLATNVAETSLTVPGIRYVVDTGSARVKRYSYRQKVEQLQIEPISQASANQRAGRCGRVAAGVCIRLYSQDDYAARPPFTDPEILRSSLAAVILRMKTLGLEEIERFPFLQPPLGRAVADGYALLQELGALDDANQLTEIGKQLAKLPLDPRVARMLLAAQQQACLSEMLIIAAALSVQDARERPFGQEDTADNAHKKFADEKSEFLSFVKLWNFYQERLQHKKSNRKLADELRGHFLHPLRLREWQDVHSQLHTTLAELGWHFNSAPATYEQLHIALLTGLLGNIACKADDAAHFNGARGIKVYPWPGSTLNKKTGRWIVAGELVETSRLFARTLARIEPEWIERVAPHLLRKTHSDPHWEKRSAQVVAFERGTVYGLLIYHGRRVNYGRLNLPEAALEARNIFIREALVAGEWQPKLPAPNFLQHNLKLVADIEQLEHRARRQDVLVDDSLIFAFYEQLLPVDVYSGTAFETWYRKLAPEQQQRWFLSRDDLMRHEAAGVTTDVFPKTCAMAGVDMALTYHFEPGSPRDGVTLTVPLYALNLVNEARCEWLVPGMLKEKAQALLKSLPQKLRRHCVPLPDYAGAFCERCTETAQDLPLLDALRQDLREQRQLQVLATDFKLETLPAHLFMNFKLVDEHGRQLAMERSLAKLRAEFGGQARGQFQQQFQDALQHKTAAVKVVTQAQAVNSAAPNSAQKVPTTPSTAQDFGLVTNWSFGELPEILELQRGDVSAVGYPALVDEQTHCRLEVFDDPQQAAQLHRAGLRRLFALQWREQLKHLEKNISNLTQMAMQFMPLAGKANASEEIKNQIMALALDRACLTEPLPTNETQFQARCQEAKPRLGLLVNEVARLAANVLDEYSAVQKKLPQAKPHAAAYADMQTQLQALLPRQFLLQHPWAQLSHLPRYLKAVVARIDKLRSDPARDGLQMAQLQPLLSNYQRKQAALKGVHDERLVEFRWLLEELRVSLFAQELRTPMPVSVKRLQKAWETLR